MECYILFDQLDIVGDGQRDTCLRVNLSQSNNGGL